MAQIYKNCLTLPTEPQQPHIMIEYIRGRIASLTPTDTTIEANGIGYMLNVSLPTYEQLQQTSPDDEVKLLVHEVIREDAWILFGFLSERERQLFRQLIGVSGVGANTARVILSAFTADELEMVIVSSDVGRLKKVKGIGAKTAERIIVDLKDKIKPQQGTLIVQQPNATESYEEALSALVMLGFTKPASQKVLEKIFKSDPTVKVEKAIKQALAML